MTADSQAGEVATPLHPLAIELAENLAHGAQGQVRVVRDDERGWLGVEEATSAMAFVEAEGDELRLVPFTGDKDSVGSRQYFVRLRPSVLDDEPELVLRLSRLTDAADRTEVEGFLRVALDYWSELASGVAPGVPPPAAPPLSETPPPGLVLPDVDYSEAVLEDTETVDASPPEGSTSVAQMGADISEQWSWASSAARIPQISTLTVSLSEPIEHARISVSVRDGDMLFGSKVLGEGPMPAGTTPVGSVHVPLSARVMSQVEERRSAECAVVLEDVGTGRILARVDGAVDVQPRDLWLWDGDPRRTVSLARMAQQLGELQLLLQEDPAHPESVEIETEIRRVHRLLQEGSAHSSALSRSLLASFVRPNHPEIAVVAREAADTLERATGDSSFHAFQMPDREVAAAKVEASITSVYDTLRERRIAYSEPPPGWDYTREGQRIRDHGEVARGGLGTCMDTTVLTAAVIEHVGLLPLLILIPGHIFVGYWRLDPSQSGADGGPDWYPRLPVVDNVSRIKNLVEAGFVGLIETTALTVSRNSSAEEARAEARYQRFASGVEEGLVTLIDVAAARREGVSPLPAVRERSDGVTEVFEYHLDAAPTVTRVDEQSPELEARHRQVDNHPARYRTWKSSLFSLNATNALLNLGSNARVQPVVLPPGGLGILEDRLNQDVPFTLLSGYDIPEVWQARDIHNAFELLETGEPGSHDELLSQLNDRRVYVQRIGRSGGRLTALPPSTLIKELRSMAHAAKRARDERGMNPLFLCIGILRWEYKSGVFADAPLILVPVHIAVSRGRQEFTLSLDTAQQTTPNAALIEWLHREHGVVVPGLTEPLTDRAGIDVDAVIAEVRAAIIDRPLSVQVQVVAEAKLATLDLSAFRMWQDLNLNADRFLEQPLVRHLVDTPTDDFSDPAIERAGEAAGVEGMAEELEKLETPIPADSTQKRAVLWARQGRTFVLQGPPGTGKSQTITNMVAECVLAGLRVLFVAEKGTALAVVERRLESIGLGPFTLNLHHEGSNATEVREQLKRALTASATPDPTAMESARRHLRTTRFELMQYPQQLHEPNAAGLSAYAAHDELLVLDDGRSITMPPHLVAHDAEKVESLRDLLQNLQQWTTAAGVRPDHPWRLAGPGDGEPFDVAVVSHAVVGVLDGARWAESMSGPVRQALDKVTHPMQLNALAAAASHILPRGDELASVLEEQWLSAALDTVTGCERAVEGWSVKLHGFSPDVLAMDLRGIATQLQASSASGRFGRAKRQNTAIAPLAAVAPLTAEVQPSTAAALLADLIAVQDAGAAVCGSLAAVPGLGQWVPVNPFQAGAMPPVRGRLDQLVHATSGLRQADEWTRGIQVLATAGHLSPHAPALAAYANSWQQLWQSLQISEPDYEAWRADRTLATVTQAVDERWRRQVAYERLLPLQQWCTLVRKLEPLRDAGLDSTREELLEGSLPAYVAEDAFARGLATASLTERMTTAGLDRFDAVAQDQRVTTYSQAQGEVRRQWETDGPGQLLERRGGHGAGKNTGGLARELEKTTRKLGTRPILRKYGNAVQELAPLVLCSPSSVVDLIEPGVMEFDVVIFDEASQITVPEAVGALGRARAAIVVGDTKQMPPTRRVGGHQADDEEIDDPDVVEIVEDQESILSECELARVPTLSLNWHYRSQDEALIAFSNRAYYRGDLSSFPTPTLLSSETGVEFRRVDGQYLRAGSGKVELANGVVAGSNTNPIEAVAIVGAIHELVHSSGERPPSVGIVTFNDQQRQLIEDLLHGSNDPKVADAMDEARMGRGEVLFVKALEQVQGDERDTIMFSVAFSKQANGKIPTNFGPLSNAGGERRLNVAVTRARRKNVIFCSFEPGELDASGSMYAGPKDLKEFLTFAKASGAIETADAGQHVAIRDRHRDDIAAALRTAGLHVMSDVGLSNFRLDLVLARPESPERPLLPVLLDGESWRKRNTVSDRDVLPVEVLKNLMGWPTVARIWWPMWLQNRDEVIERILSEVDRAESTLARESEPTTTATPVAADDPLDAGEVANPDVEANAADMSGASQADGQPSWDDPNDEHLFAMGQIQPMLGSLLDPESPPPAPDTRTQPPDSTPMEPVTSQAQGPARDTTPPAAEPASRAAHQPPVPVEESFPEFTPAHTNVVSSRAVLDALPNRAAAATVREELLDVIDTEGPVELTRLTRIVARRFGLSAVRAARADDIARLVPRGQLRKSRLGTFAWPASIDPATWTEFRVADPDFSRTLDEVAPEEIANAMRVVKAEYPELDRDDVLRLTAEWFGILRLGANVRTRLETVFKRLTREQGITSRDA